MTTVLLFKIITTAQVLHFHRTRLIEDNQLFFFYGKFHSTTTIAMYVGAVRRWKTVSCVKKKNACDRNMTDKPSTFTWNVHHYKHKYMQRNPFLLGDRPTKRGSLGYIFSCSDGHPVTYINDSSMWLQSYETMWYNQPIYMNDFSHLAYKLWNCWHPLGSTFFFKSNVNM